MPDSWWLLTPLVGLLAWLAALTVGIWTSMLNALYRDFGYIVPFTMQIGFFVTPVLFQTSVLVPPALAADFCA